MFYSTSGLISFSVFLASYAIGSPVVGAATSSSIAPVTSAWPGALWKNHVHQEVSPRNVMTNKVGTPEITPIPDVSWKAEFHQDVSSRDREWNLVVRLVPALSDIPEEGTTGGPVVGALWQCAVHQQISASTGTVASEIGSLSMDTVEPTPTGC
ncbi:hypothetical protein BJ138DRAFT_1124307 [Hygrophoropsis aurantiaca]|uniref:Uncharacterized protein n=1 Tax=Hygrophoropsis aurantiaca TaxID=72124 RepID=A0ACB8AJW6_9AGAM|nr:hypothetical protein BJ138DRAFT_1124307 [Hygrophoropsis aurantiaca]